MKFTKDDKGIQLALHFIYLYPQQKELQSPWRHEVATKEYVTGPKVTQQKILM